MCIGTLNLRGEMKIGLLVLIWAMVTLLVKSFVYTYQPPYNSFCSKQSSRCIIEQLEFL